MNSPGSKPGPTPARRIATIALSVAALVALLAWEAARTLPVRRALDTYNRLISAANAGDLDAVSALYSARLRRAHLPRPAPEEGVIGLPRNGPHKNFRAWRHGPEVLVCPTNRVGPVYRFVFEAGGWKFDGPVGLLLPNGRIEPSGEIDPGDESDSGPFPDPRTPG